MNKILKKYKHYFSEINELYDYQEEAIDNILSYKNTLSIVPTGGGKSLIFQLCALEFPGISIVISPLVALMIEQVNYLKEKGIAVISINSNSTFSEQRSILRDLRKTKPKIIYVSPERLQNYYFRSAILNSGQNISMIVIDEAHCISQWGIDFRPEYAQIKSFVDYLNEKNQTPVIYALTATLSVLPRNDIKNEYDIDDNSELISRNVIRDNINLKFAEVCKEKDKFVKAISFLRDIHSKKAIIYMYNKKKCEEVSRKINEEGVSSEYYHSELDINRKEKIYEGFKEGKINVLVSTTAFGMGMNIPDIDSILHYHLPGSVEEFYQQVGRAARDKTKCPLANCLGLWSEENFKVLKRRIRKENSIDIEILQKAFDYFGLYNSPNSISSIDYTTYKNSNINLPLIRYLFEKHGIMKAIGEVNGTPKTIEFVNTPKYWEDLLSFCDIDSFIDASIRGKYNIEDIINFVHQEDLKGNITKIPAWGKTLFFVNYYEELPSDISETIISEVNRSIDFKIQQLEQLEELFKLKTDSNHREYIAKILGVKYP